MLKRSKCVNKVSTCVDVREGEVMACHNKSVALYSSQSFLSGGENKMDTITKHIFDNEHASDIGN